jgi:plastocyanin
MLRMVVAVAGLAVLAFAGGFAPAGAQDQAVTIQDFSFSPATVQITPGTTVTWTNQGAAPHTVTSDGGVFDSGRLDAGQSFSHTFATAGTFSYHCAIHPQMTATIVVAAAGAPVQMPKTGTGSAIRTGSDSAPLILAGLFAMLGLAAMRWRRIA